MSPNPIKNFFKANFDKTLERLGILDSEEIKYCIYPTTKTENYTNFDDSYRMWATPTFKGIRITYDEVLQNLIKVDQNAIPLWIKIKKNSKTLVILEISQRFRKIKQIIERKPNNEITPFEIVENLEFLFSLAEERKEAIRILFFKRLIDENVSKIIGSSIKYRELKAMFLLHFKNYRFYPALYNHFKIGDERFSKLVIEKDFNSNQFKIFTNNAEGEVMKNDINFDSTIDYFLQNELNWEYRGINIINEVTE